MGLTEQRLVNPVFEVRKVECGMWPRNIRAGFLEDKWKERSPSLVDASDGNTILKIRDPFS